MEALSVREQQIFLIICRMEEAPTLEEILTKANEKYKRNWRSQTISTFLARSMKKGYITSQKIGRYHHYYPTVTLAEYQEAKLLEMKCELFENDWKQMEISLGSVKTKEASEK